MIKTGVIVYYIVDNKYYILIGKESRFLYEADGITEVEKKYIQDLEIYKVSSDKSNKKMKKKAKRYFDKCVKKLKILFKKRYGNIKYDQIVHDENGNFKVNYRYIINDAQLGIPKGSKEIFDKTLQDTAKRELTEECGEYFKGVDLGAEYFEAHDYLIYELKIEIDQLSEVLLSINKKNNSNYQELFELAFYDITEYFSLLEKNKTPFNSFTRIALKGFLRKHKLIPESINRNKKIEQHGGTYYYDKYIKYKLKYHKLKNQLDGY